ncbi:MAG: hypothetical protein AAGA66_03025 [Bacteroidota bacterium]
MSNTRYVYLKYENSELLYSNAESGPFEKVEEETTVSDVWQKDTVTFQALPDSGIKKLLKIKGGRNGSKKLMKRRRRKNKMTITTSIRKSCCAGEIDKFDIKFRSESGEKIIIDPRLQADQPS